MNIKEARELLQKLNKAINTPENGDALVATGVQAGVVASALGRLSRAGNLNQSNFMALVAAGERANAVAYGLVRLHVAGIPEQVTRDALVAAEEHANAVAEKIISQKDNQISMPILSGFIKVLGIAAIAVAFTVLNDSETLGIPVIVVASIGFGAILTGAGLFATKAYRTNEPAVNERVPDINLSIHS